MCGWQEKLCDPLVTHGPYLSTLEIRLGIIKHYTNGSFTLLLLACSNSALYGVGNNIFKKCDEFVHNFADF